MKPDNELTPADATHLHCVECDHEEPLDFVPSVDDYPGDCPHCGEDTTEFLIIEDATEADLGQDDVRDRRRFGGKIERVREIPY